MSARKFQEEFAVFWSDRCKQIVQEKEVMNDEDRADLETFISIAIELVKAVNPSRLKKAATDVEIRYWIKKK